MQKSHYRQSDSASKTVTAANETLCSTFKAEQLLLTTLLGRTLCARVLAIVAADGA
ncbi:MAG: hypothetical protein JWR16_1874 [Nevskia sp.]|nr:hypothetical protein [Nevskia sp.]